MALIIHDFFGRLDKYYSVVQLPPLIEIFTNDAADYTGYLTYERLFVLPRLPWPRHTA